MAGREFNTQRMAEPRLKHMVDKQYRRVKKASRRPLSSKGRLRTGS